MCRSLRLFALALLGCLAAAGPAAAGTRFTIRGAGFGHGVGMSQYGAYGYALHGAGYQAILAHYYQGTALGTVAPGRTVRVLLQSGRGAMSFTGAARAGVAVLDPTKTYRALRHGLDEVDLRGPMRAGAGDDELAALIRAGVWRKWEGHRINHPDFVRPARSMSMIGG